MEATSMGKDKLYVCHCNQRFKPQNRPFYDGKRFWIIKARYVKCPGCGAKVWTTTIWGKKKFTVS